MNYLSCSEYLSPILDPKRLQQTIDETMEVLSELKRLNVFDAIAVMGNSGCLLGGIVAYKLNKNIILVRKNNDTSHSPLQVEGPRDGRYIILDDQICTGKTICQIVELIRRKHCEHSQCTGAYLYYHKKFYTDYQIKNIIEQYKSLIGIKTPSMD